MLAPFDIALLDEILQPIAHSPARRIVLVLELDHEIGDDVASVRYHPLQHLVGMRWIARSGHVSCCSLRHLIIVHVAKNYSSWPCG
jgi:hypothetical protein